MNTASPKQQKTRADCQIDAKLNPAAADHLASQLENGMSLSAAVRFLAQEHAVGVSESSVSRWAAKRRRRQAEMTFASVREQLEIDEEQALALCDDVETLDKLFKANVVLATRALFAEQRAGNQQRVAKATHIFAQVLGAVTKVRNQDEAAVVAFNQAIARMESSVDRHQRVNIARERFEFDVEKTAAEHSAALTEINATEMPQRERIARAIRVLFPSRDPAPQAPATPADAAKPPANEPPDAPSGERRPV